MPVTGRVTNLAKFASRGSIKKPNFFIVGAPKSGTTSMYYYLKKHPEIFMSVPKEPLYFCKDLENHRLRTREMTEYLSFFKGAQGHRLVGEASTWYLYSNTAARRISDFAPESKIIIMLRSIPEAMYSLHSQYLFLGNETVRDFREALSLEPERARGESIPEAAYFPEGLLYSRVYRYVDQVRRYLEWFDRDQVLVVTLDELKRDVRLTYRRIVNFLGLEEIPSLNFDKYNSNCRFRSRFLQDLVQNVSGDTKGSLRDLLPVRPCMKIWRELEPVVVEDYPGSSLDEDLRRDLLADIEPEVRELEDLVDRDLSHWLS